MDNIKYYPILKWKAGEKRALQALTPETSHISPIIEIVDYQDINNILKSFLDLKNIKRFYIDTSYIEEEECNYKKEIIKQASSIYVNLFPIFTYDEFFTHAESFLNFCSDFLVKIPVPQDFDREDYDTIFERLKVWEGKNNASLSILLDAGLIVDKVNANRQFSELKSILSNNLNHNKFEKIIVCLTSFPEDISKIQAGGVEYYYRYDIRIFEKLLESIDDDLKTRLCFSDYGVTKYTETELDFSKLRHSPLPKVRYTTNENYWVLKGKRDSITKKMEINYQIMAQTIVNSNNFYGKDYSFGDLEIFERAQGHKINNPEEKVGPGNNTNWVTIAANHHITVVTKELSNLF